MGVGGLIMPPSSGSQRDREQGRKRFLMSLLELRRLTPRTCAHTHACTYTHTHSTLSLGSASIHFQSCVHQTQA